MSTDETQIILIPDETEDVMYAFNYLVKKLQKKNEEMIAADLGISRARLYQLRNEWEASGAFNRARELMIGPVIQDNELAYVRAAMEMPAIIERVVEIAKSSKYERVALEAAMFLEERITSRVMEQKSEPGAAESAYADKPGDYNPGVIRRLSAST